MLERYIRTPDGKDYVDEDCVMEALGIVDDDVNFFRVIKKLREDNDLLEESHANNISQLKEYAELAFELGIESGDAENIKDYIISLKRERDELKEKCDKLKRRANAMYGASCGKEPAFLCDVVSYSWELAPRYKFLSILSSELGFRSIVGPGNVEKIEQDILRVVKHRNERTKKDADDRREFLRKLGCELGVRYPIVKLGGEEKVEADILERIGELKEGNWPCENDVTFAEFMKKEFPKVCEKWNVVPLQEGSVHDWVQYIFSILDEWRKRAVKAEEELDRAWSHCGKLKGMLNTWYGASCGDNVLPCYRDTCNNPKAIRERDAAKDALAELRAKIRDVCNEIFDCSNGDPEGSDKEVLEDILEEYRRVIRNFETLKRQLDDEKKLVSKVRAERDSNKARRLVFLDKLANVLDVSYSSGFIPAKEQDILRAVQTLSENYEATTRVLEEKRKEYDSLEALYKSSLKLLGEYVTDAKDILGIDSCEKDTVVSAIKALKSAYNSLRNDYDEVCEGYTKLKKDYDELGEAYSSVLKWNNSYADVRRLLEVPADADAGEMVGALNKLVCDYEKLKKEYEKTKCNTNYFVEFEKNCRERQAFIVKLCEALDIDTEDIGSFFDDEEAAILKAIEEDLGRDLCELRKNAIEDLKSRGFCFRPEENETLPEIYDKLLKGYDWAYESYKDQYRLRQCWHVRYESENERANGEHKRAEKLNKEVRDWTKRCDSLEQALNAKSNEEVGLSAFKNECRKLKDEKAKVISALGQDIWDDCVK